MEAKSILQKVRFTLGDEAGDRWSDNRLLDLIDEAQKDICLHTNMLRSDQYVALIQGKYTYDLPEDAILTHRIQSIDCEVPFRSRDDMDQKNCYWRTIEGHPVTAIIKDSIPSGKFEVYPIPNEETFYIPTYEGIIAPDHTTTSLIDPNGVLSDFKSVPDNHAGMIEIEGVFTQSDAGVIFTDGSISFDETPWGVLVDYYIITNIDGIVGIYSDYSEPAEGVLSDLSGINTVDEPDTQVWGVLTEIDGMYGYVDNSWGCVTNIINGDSVLQVLYTQEPQTLLFDYQELQVGNIWANAMKYYTCGYALLDDNDAGNIGRGKEFLARYERELTRAFKLISLEHHSNGNARVTNYQTAFRR